MALRLFGTLHLSLIHICEASEGCVLAKKDGEFAAIIALKCETDFVAKNADFVALTPVSYTHLINKRDLAQYFPSTILQYGVKQPLNKLEAVSYTHLVPFCTMEPLLCYL